MDQSVESPAPRLFTPRFFLLCSFTFTTFVSAFLLFPTMPFRILTLEGNKSDAGLFLGFLTYASALSAPFGGAIADRIGKRPVLLASSTAIFVFDLIYAFARSLPLILAISVLHGIFWSALMAASAALMSDMLPPTRRTEGLGYWGFASVLAIAAAPPLGLFLLHFGWLAVSLPVALLAVGMFVIAFRVAERSPAHAWRGLSLCSGRYVEKEVLVLSVTLLLYSFGYGGVTSFVPLYAQESGVAFRGIYFVVFSVTILATRPYLGPLADRIGAAPVLLPLLGLISIAFAILAVSGRLPYLISSAIVFGIGFGSAYPVFASYMLGRVDARKRGATFGGFILAFDTGIGSGSVLLGSIIERWGYRPAFVIASVLAALSIPYFLLARRSLRIDS
jgi:MFS family permease